MLEKKSAKNIHFEILHDYDQNCGYPGFGELTILKHKISSIFSTKIQLISDWVASILIVIMENCKMIIFSECFSNI